MVQVSAILHWRLDVPYNLNVPPVCIVVGQTNNSRAVLAYLNSWPVFKGYVVSISS